MQLLADTITYDFVVRTVRGSKRFPLADETPTAKEAEAARELAEAALATGGWRAIDVANRAAYAQLFAQKFDTLYGASEARAAAGHHHDNNIARLKRLRADVAGVADAVADFELSLWLAGPATKITDGAFDGALAEQIARVDTPPTKFNADVTVFCGSVRFGNVSGYESSRAKSFVEELGKAQRVILLSEFMTSQLCWSCGEKIVKTRASSVRYHRCPHRAPPTDGPTMVKNRQGKQRHVHEENKDTIAALSMLRIGVTLLLTGKKLKPWCTEDQIEQHEQHEKSLQAAAPTVVPAPTPAAALATTGDVDEPADDGQAKRRRTSEAT